MGSLWLLTILSKRPHPSASALHSPKVKTKYDNVCLESKSELVHLTHQKKIEVTKWYKRTKHQRNASPKELVRTATRISSARM